jgi:L-amino acid N-acyltransferase YncA
MQARLRLATESDAPGILAVYGPFCDHTSTSFEAYAPSLEEMRERVRKIAAQYPWLVCTCNNNVLGYAYAGPHRERAAYRWGVEVAVYIGEGSRRAGMGRALYTALFDLLVAQGYYKAYAGVTLPNPASVGLHEAMGFRPIGVYHGVGYKFGAWHDVGWWELSLQREQLEPNEPRSVHQIADSSEGQSALDKGASLLRA